MKDQPKKKAATRKKPAKKKATKKKATPKVATVPQEAQVAESQAVEGPELMANGLKFFSQLAQTLNDKEATSKLIDSITEYDEATGQAYLKVPVENQKTIEDAFTMLSTLFKALQ